MTFRGWKESAAESADERHRPCLTWAELESQRLQVLFLGGGGLGTFGVKTAGAGRCTSGTGTEHALVLCLKSTKWVTCSGRACGHTGGCVGQEQGLEMVPGLCVAWVRAGKYLGKRRCRRQYWYTPCGSCFTAGSGFYPVHIIQLLSPRQAHEQHCILTALLAYLTRVWSIFSIQGNSILLVKGAFVKTQLLIRLRTSLPTYWSYSQSRQRPIALPPYASAKEHIFAGDLCSPVLFSSSCLRRAGDSKQKDVVIVALAKATEYAHAMAQG